VGSVLCIRHSPGKVHLAGLPTRRHSIGPKSM
jgi:hypothetical protein